MDGFKRPVRRPDGTLPSVGTGVPATRPVERAPSTTPVPPRVLPAPVAAEAIPTEDGTQPQAVPPVEQPGDSLIDLQPPEITDKVPERVLKKKRSTFAKVMIGIGIALAAAIIAAIAGYAWYFSMTLAPNPSDDRIVGFEVKPDTSINTIASQLKERGLIKDTLAFNIYARLSGRQNAIQTGTCNLSPAETVREIMDKLTAGCHDFKSVTFYPGATIKKPIFKPEGSTISLDLYVKNMLRKAGYTDAQITEALAADYTGPLFAGKPAGTTLEGYIFGETYHVSTSATAREVLQEALDHLYKIVQQDDLIAKYQAHGLNLYQGLTLASIVQRELNCEDKPTKERKDRCHAYQKTIASVFYNRLKTKMPLGSDSTFIYAADMLGVPATSRIDSPYNTYRVTGLPPGPIGSPGELALDAVANPDTTDYLYFVAGDDGLLYFSRTQAEHEANTAKYCHVLCAY